MQQIVSLILLLIFTITAQSQSSLKFDYDESLILLKLHVNGKKNLVFLLNSGANTSVIDKAIAQDLKLPVIKQLDSVEGTAGKEPLAIVKTKNIMIGNIMIKNQQITSRDLRGFLSWNGQRIDGILGTDILKNLAYTINFKNRIISFQQTKIPSANRKFIVFTMDEGIPQFNVRLNDTLNTLLHYNSGSRLQQKKEVYINLAHTQWVEMKKLYPRLRPEKYMTGSGVGGNLFMEVVSLQSLKLNKYIAFENCKIIVQPKEGYFKKEDAIGFFGNNLLEKYDKVSVDFISRKLIVYDKEKPRPTTKKIVKKRRKR